MTVDPDGSVRHCAVEHDREVTIFGIFRQKKCLAIPTRAENWQRASVGINFRIKWTFNGPVVGQAERRPLRVIELRIFSPTGISLVEAPILIKADAPFSG